MMSCLGNIGSLKLIPVYFAALASFFLIFKSMVVCNFLMAAHSTSYILYFIIFTVIFRFKDGDLGLLHHRADETTIEVELF
jgi:hypothetical protein